MTKADIEEQLKQALKAGDKNKTSTLRLILSAVKNQEIAQGKSIDKTGLTQLLQKEAKKRRQSIEMYQQAKRSDLVDQERAELKIINSFLPKMITENELREIIRHTQQELDTDKFSVLMPAVMVKVKGRADGAQVAQFVKQELQA